MRLAGERAAAAGLLLLDQVEFEPGCLVFELERPLLLRVGDQPWREGDRAVVVRTSGAREHRAGSMALVYRHGRRL